MTVYVENFKESSKELSVSASTNKWGFPGSSDRKGSACNVGDLGSVPGSGRSPGEGNGNPHHYSCLENSMYRGAVGYSPWNHKGSDRTEQLSGFSKSTNNKINIEKLIIFLYEHTDTEI